MVILSMELSNNNFLLDTDGEITIVSPKIIEDINKSSYGNSVCFRMSVEK